MGRRAADVCAEFTFAFDKDFLTVQISFTFQDRQIKHIGRHQMMCLPLSTEFSKICTEIQLRIPSMWIDRGDG